MNRNTSITLGSHFDMFVKGSVVEGRYKNASEVIRAGLRLLEDEENKVLILRESILDGINSGEAKKFDPKKHLVSLKAKK